MVLILKKLLKFVKADKLTDLINERELFGKLKLRFNVTKVIISFVKWILYLIFLIIASDIMKWEAISLEIGNLLRYLPKLFSAIALFMIGIYVANFVKRTIQGLFDSFNLSGSKMISGLVFLLIAILITITALNQADIETEIITSNFTIILGAFLAAIAIAFGFGSKEIIGDLLRTFYVRKNFEVGQKIKFKNYSGSIESIENISLTLKTSEGKVVLPIKDVVENDVEILD